MIPPTFSRRSAEHSRAGTTLLDVSFRSTFSGGSELPMSIAQLQPGSAKMGRMPEPEQPLEGGNSNPDVVRVGDRVHRLAGPWTPAVHQLLEHLADRRYPAPRPFGMDDQGREVLSFVSGECLHPDGMHLVSTDAGLRRVGRLVADYHRAQEGFVPPVDARWRDEGRDPSGSTEVFAHNDLAPWNLVAGLTAWVFIDWDLVAPGRRLWDLAWALHSFVGLWPESELDDSTIVAHIDAFCDGAEVDHRARPGLLGVVIERTRENVNLIWPRRAQVSWPRLAVVRRLVLSR